MEPIIPFSSLIIVEPMISPAGPQYLRKLRTVLVKGAYERRDVWPDLEQAMGALKRRDRTKKWDSRILDLFNSYIGTSKSAAVGRGGKAAPAAQVAVAALRHVDPIELGRATGGSGVRRRRARDIRIGACDIG